MSRYAQYATHRGQHCEDAYFMSTDKMRAEHGNMQRKRHRDLIKCAAVFLCFLLFVLLLFVLLDLAQ